MENNLEYSNTQSLGELASTGVFVGIAENPKTGKLFLVDAVSGNKLGAVATKIEPIIRKNGKDKTWALPADWCVSDVYDNVKDESFKMLHERGTQARLIASSKPVAQQATRRV